MKMLVALILATLLMLWGLEHIWIGLDKKAQGSSWHSYMNFAALYLVADVAFVWKYVLPLIN